MRERFNPSNYGNPEENEVNLPQDQLSDFIIDIENANDNANVWERIGENGNDDFEALSSVSKKMEALSEKYTDFLAKTGLELDLRETLFVPLPEEEREKDTSKHIILNIVDSEKFIGLLKGFEDSALDKNRIEGLSDVANMIRLQIQRFYKVHESDDDFLGVIPVIKTMAEELEKFSQATGNHQLQVDAEAFAAYSEAIQGKYLREYLRLENLEFDWEYHVTDEYYGRTPSPETHSVEGYEEVMGRFLETLRECAKNINALELVKQKIDWFKNCLTDAEKVLETKKEKKKRGYIAVNTNLRKKLEQLEKSIQ
ncbi:MAG: hypothetical protein A3E37_02510 [Candidatus Andersenbacteria bacterium RIFCSPHIGHO2_12_FULL_46_9]|nr:MAG: hypothetical protein A3B76_03390 [Candidatus Andersenbacteria bacterium RIFCSPHIGHO2_02_FULL_46_16]OGY37397.1 MAG: hypothetical protein A3E37_02510 [Candidatus Andersenbacteria bacterium RIFCSPHIGHO2_12_FULL_46_9]OGY37461.1 MAG: hypothetical protein A3I08_00305 [Candidatus Andersenbacteria bacterium RIFCSPLOWO2_02_FULL_46_11]OGY38581.1 MAG: hypothetical protein A3G57_04800 [Candidatus Andersenbacteria bacterium RIFCSPLOWO2_12_FULL_45_8]HBE89752.1 hypothetical protein [Candidatus Anderse